MERTIRVRGESVTFSVDLSECSRGYLASTGMGSRTIMAIHRMPELAILTLEDATQRVLEASYDERDRQAALGEHRSARDRRRAKRRKSA